MFNKHAKLLAKKLGERTRINERVSIYPFMTLCALDSVSG